MKIKFLGHAAVEIVSATGCRILFDPYMPGYSNSLYGSLFHGPITEAYDVVGVTHEHAGHNAVSTVPGSFEVVRGMSIMGQGVIDINGISFWSVDTFHDNRQGGVDGQNSILCCEVDGIKIGHSGDLGHIPTRNQIDELKKHGLDVFLLCIGMIEKKGTRHEKIVIDTESKIINGIWATMNPFVKVLIPIHYRCSKSDCRLLSLEEFCKNRDVIRNHVNEITLVKDDMNTSAKIIVLEPAL